MYRWDFDTTARRAFADLGHTAREALAAFMGAVVIVDPLQYQRDLASLLIRASRCAHYLSAQAMKVS
jgi:hypothetical protein